jgi:hypothetical protein
MMDGENDDDEDEAVAPVDVKPEELALLAWRIGDVLASAGEYETALQNFFLRSVKEYKKVSPKHKMLAKVYNSMANTQESAKE